MADLLQAPVTFVSNRESRDEVRGEKNGGANDWFKIRLPEFSLAFGERERILVGIPDI